MVISIWDEYFWLPEGVSWSDLKSNSTITYPQVSDLKYTVIGGCLLLVLRILLESFVFLPIGWLFGFVKTPILGRVWAHLTGGFKGKSKFKRVAECVWRCSFYVFAWIAGLRLLWDSPQLNDVTECWRNWPHHNLPDGIWWYYIVEASFYWALFIGTSCFDIRRADYYQMMTHHGITILLLYISWSMNMVRVGTLILFSHDAADIFIEFAKVLRYGRYDTVLNGCFVILMIIWIATRLIYYPFWVLQSIWFDAPRLLQANYEWRRVFQRPQVPRVLMVMLSLLLLLHIFWTYVLLRVAYKSATATGVIEDVREDEDSSDTEDYDSDSSKTKKD